MPKLINNNRRRFIKMMSGAAATPFLMLPSRNAFAQSKPPLRCLTLIDTYGLPTKNRGDLWLNRTSGDFALEANQLGTVLKPLEDYIDNMIVVSGIDMDSQIKTRDSKTHHQLATHTLTGSSLLNGTRDDEPAQAVEHASIDIHIGKYLHNEYGLSSSRIFDHLFFTDYTQRDSATYCYNTNGKQKRSIAGALNARDALFDDNQVSSNDAFNQISNQARLDALRLVEERIGNLADKLNNTNHNDVFKAYQESIEDVSRELNLKNENVIAIPNELARGITNSRGSNKDNPNDLANMFKNIYHAFAFDLVSSVTYAFGGEKINQHRHSYLNGSNNDKELNSLLNKNLHAASHRTDDTANKVHELVRAYQSRELKTLLDRLSTTIDSDGSSILDNTVVFFTSQMSNNTHKTTDYPLFMIAGKNTNLRAGFHYDCNRNTNNDLMTTLAQGLTLPDDNFGGHDRSGKYLSALNNGAISKILKS